MSSPTLTSHHLPNTILYFSMHDICCLKLILWCACFCERFFTCLHSITFKSVEKLTFLHHKLNCERKTASWMMQNDQDTYCISVFMQNVNQDVNPKILIPRFSVPYYIFHSKANPTFIFQSEHLSHTYVPNNCAVDSHICVIEISNLSILI